MVYDSDKYVIQGSSLVSYFGNEQEVRIPDGVVEIKSSAFNKCENLERVFVPASVLFIKRYAFIGCAKLQCINIDPLNKRYSSFDGIVYSKDEKNLVRVPAAKCEVEIRPGTKHIGRGAFSSCQIESVAIPDTVVTIGDCAFRGCSNLSKLIIPDNVQVVGNSAFSECAKLTEIRLSTSLEIIHAHLFSKCSSLAYVSIPRHVKKIEFSAFSACPNLIEINVDKSNAQYTSSNGMLFQKRHDGTLTLLCVPQALPGEISLSECVTDIEYYAFFRCKQITKVIIPASVRPSAYTKWAFSGCTSLHFENIIVPTGYIKHKGIMFVGDSFDAEPCITVEPHNYDKLQKQVLNDFVESLIQQ